ncbi:MAG: enoyl-CoA hydratase-related protein [Paracoccaceae bacterium]|nr:enoyl-CoA hydratase-related protein [Paracoccaceae bacterium]
MAGSVTKVERDSRGIATIWLARSERNNAYNAQMIAELTEGAAALAEDPDVRVAVIRGEGRHFQAGADLAWIDSLRGLSPEDSIAVSRRTTDAVFGLTKMPKPVIALVHGGCFGGGTGIVAACDIVIADEAAIFSITEARWGLTALPIMPQLLSRIGPGHLRRYALTCERFDARRALEIGLVDEVCGEGSLDEASAPVIDALLHCPPQALADSKAGILSLSGLDFEDARLDDLARPHGLKRLDDEAGEGLKSFLEKRKPAWYPGG